MPGASRGGARTTKQCAAVRPAEHTGYALRRRRLNDVSYLPTIEDTDGARVVRVRKPDGTLGIHTNAIRVVASRREVGEDPLLANAPSSAIA